MGSRRTGKEPSNQEAKDGWTVGCHGGGPEKKGRSVWREEARGKGTMKNATKRQEKGETRKKDSADRRCFSSPFLPDKSFFTRTPPPSSSSSQFSLHILIKWYSQPRFTDISTTNRAPARSFTQTLSALAPLRVWSRWACEYLSV